MLSKPTHFAFHSNSIPFYATDNIMRNKKSRRPQEAKAIEHHQTYMSGITCDWKRYSIPRRSGVTKIFPVGWPVPGSARLERCYKEAGNENPERFVNYLNVCVLNCRDDVILSQPHADVGMHESVEPSNATSCFKDH